MAAELGQLPFTADKAESLYEAVLASFQSMADDRSQVIGKLESLLTTEGYYAETQQFEQLNFKELGSLSVTAMLEKVQLNDKEGNLIKSVIEDVVARYGRKEALPVAVADLKQFQSPANTITVRVTGVPFAGVEVLAFIMVADRLFDLRPQFKETLADRIQIEKSADETKFKSLCDEDVWFSHLEIVDDQTLAFEFIVLTFETMASLRKRLEEGSIGTRRSSTKLSGMIIPDDKPWYGTKRYDIVDHVLKLQEKKDGQLYRSAVQEAALKAQKPFLTQTMKDIQVGFEGPPKYLNQRDAPLEIPSDVIKAFFRAADANANDRLSIDELFAYAEKHRLPFTKDEIAAMFLDATKNRAVVLEKHRHDPLTQEEVIAAVRGRHRWNTQTKEWEVTYRPTRDQWIIMLQTVSDRLFAMPVPKVVPTKIKAQYEQEEETMRMIDEGTFSFTKQARAEGIDRRYLSVKEQKEPLFRKELDKPEGKVIPQGPSVLVAPKKEKKFEKNPYEQLINGRLQVQANGYPTVGFEARELFDQANFLSQVVPNWKSDKENPIFKYVPSTEQAFSNDSEHLFNDELHNKLHNQTLREQRLLDLQGKDRSKLMLAGTIALKSSHTSPWQVMKEREGFVTKFKVPSLLDSKVSFAVQTMNSIDKKTGAVLGHKENPYSNPKDHVFRDDELRFNQKDFVRQIRPAPAYNQHNLSEFNSKPQFVYQKQRKADEAEEQRKKDEYLLQLKGESAFNPQWVQYHKLPDTLTPITAGLKEKHLPKNVKPKEASPFLPRDEYASGYERLVQILKDDAVFGKPEFDLYYKGLKPEDRVVEFGDLKTKPFTCI